MKFTANRKIMLENLKTMFKVVPKTSNAQELTGFLIEANEDDGFVYLTANNLEASIQRKIKPVVETGGTFVMNAKMLVDILTALGGTDVVFEEVKPGRITIKAENCVYTMSVMNGRLYPRPEMPFPDNTVKVRGLKQLYLATMSTVSTDTVHSSLQGIHIDITENSVKAISCNVQSASVASVEMKTGGRLSFTLPKVNYSYLASAIADDDELEVGQSGAYIVFMKKGMMFSSRCLVHEYVDIEPLFNNIRPIYTAKVEYDDFKAELCNICDVALMGKEKSYIKMDFSENEITLSTTNDVGSSATAAKCTRISGNEHTFYYQPGKLKNLFKVLDGTMILQLDSKGFMIAFTRNNKFLISPIHESSVGKQKLKIDEIKAGTKKTKKSQTAKAA